MTAGEAWPEWILAAELDVWDGLSEARRVRLGTTDMRVDLGTVIAERQLRVKDHPKLDVRVKLGAPRPYERDYYCPYQIVGIGKERVKYASGVDAVQALELAIWILPTELDTLSREYPGLGWLDAPDGDYGFSRAVSAFYPNEPRIESE